MTNDKRHLIPPSANNKRHDSFDDDEQQQQQNTANRDLVGSYRRTSFAYGEFRPTFIPGSPLSTSINTLPATERETMLEQEQELLRDSVKNYGSYGTLPRPTTSSSNASLTSLGPPEFPEFLNERSRLLREPACWEEAVERGVIHTTYLREAKVVLQSAPLLYITFALQYSLTIASIFSAGRLGKDQLAGVSLGSMTATITGYAVYQGLTTALDTLCSQSYGSGNKTLVGLHLQRMVYFLFCVSVPISIVWMYSEPILNAMVPEKELVAFASLYLRILTLGLPAYAMFESGKRFLQAQGLFMASTYVLLICAPFNAFLNYTLVWNPKIGLGFIGAPIAIVITEWLMALILFLYVKLIAGGECWGGFSKAGLRNWWPMINLAVPGLIMLEAEWLAFEILTLLASYWSTAHVAANSVISTTASLTFQLPFALSVAVSTRVANLLGATLGDSARTTARLGLLMAACVGLFNFALIMTFRRRIVTWFSDDPEVIRLYIGAVPLAATFQLFDAFGTCTAGLLRGQGRQHLGSYINLTAYYVLALPIAFVLAFYWDWELVGLWTGVALGLLFIAVVEVVIILRTNWDQVVDEAKTRVEHS